MIEKLDFSMSGIWNGISTDGCEEIHSFYKELLINTIDIKINFFFLGMFCMGIILVLINYKKWE